MPDQLDLRVRKTILDHGMLAGGEHVLVAVSGGADSTALLLCLSRLAPEFRLTLTVAHLNHGIRGAESDADEEFVRKMSARADLPFISETVDIKCEAIDQKQNLEQLARRKRYEFLARTAERVGAQKIAVGHTLNDQAETALFRFIRGSGVEGLSAIFPVVNGLVIRPLLHCSRSSILQYLERLGAAHREDSTNNDLRHTRNRIRRELLPYLEQHFNPRLIETLAREAQLAQETWSFIKGQAEELFEQVHSKNENGIFIRVADLEKMPPALQKQVVRLALRTGLGSLQRITAAHIESILSICRKEQSGSRVQLPQGGIAWRQFNDLVLSRRPLPEVSAFLHEVHVPGRCFVPEIGAEFTLAASRAPDRQTMKEACSTQAFLKASALPGSLVIRPRLPGDRYGGEGRRKVKKMLINSRIPMPQRSILPMIVAGTDVIWIPGFRPARGYEAGQGSSDCVSILMEKK